MTKEIELLIKKNMSADIQIAMLTKEIEGQIISKDIILEILAELTK